MFARISALAIVFAGYTLAGGQVDAGSSKVTGFTAESDTQFPAQSFPALALSPGIPIPEDDTTARNQTSDRCGELYGSCSDGLCCSGKGYCGSSPAHCGAPDCQYLYSTGCDASKLPGGEDTSVFLRDRLGDIPYGAASISECAVPYTISLTFDDGPYIYTRDLLDLLDSYGAKATFFVTAINGNKGAIDDPKYPWVNILRRMDDSGHQIASHTWSHQDLDAAPPGRRRAQMIKNEMALRNVLGKFPTYMRPPYSRCTAATGCLRDMEELGYHVTYYDVETSDWSYNTPETIQYSKDVFDDALKTARTTGKPLLVIAHDVHEQTVYNLTSHMLREIYATKHTPVTLGECLGDPKANWYRADKHRSGDRRSGKGRSGKGGRRKHRRPGWRAKSPDVACEQCECTASDPSDCSCAKEDCENGDCHCENPDGGDDIEEGLDSEPAEDDGID